MERKTKLKIAATGTGVALILGGAGIASADTTNSKGSNPFSRALSSLVGKGTITQNQADEITKALDADRTAQNTARSAAQTARESLVASTLGIDAATIKTRMAAGETLATIAGTKTDVLIAALVKFESTEIDARVTAGNLTAAQATTEKAALQTRIAAEISNAHGMMGGRPSIGGGNGGGMMGDDDGDHGMMAGPRGGGMQGGPRGGGMQGGPRGGGMMGVSPQHQATVAKVLGLDWSAIQTRLAAGETLAKIAGTKTDALIAALVTEENTEIDARVTAGQMTAAEATTAKAAVQARETAIVNGTAPVGGPSQDGPGRGGKSGRGHGGGFDGPNAGGGASANGGLTNKASGSAATSSNLTSKPSIKA